MNAAHDFVGPPLSRTCSVCGIKEFYAETESRGCIEGLCQRGRGDTLHMKDDLRRHDGFRCIDWRPYV